MPDIDTLRFRGVDYDIRDKGAVRSVNSHAPDANGNVSLASDVVDNLTSTSTTLPLSANMGKALSDTIVNFRNISDGVSSSSPSTNANNIRQNGTWKSYEWTNTPNGHSIGILSAYYYDSGYGYQLFDDYYDGGLYRRQIVSSSWGSWQKLVTDT